MGVSECVQAGLSSFVFVKWFCAYPYFLIMSVYFFFCSLLNRYCLTSSFFSIKLEQKRNCLLAL